MSPVMGKCLDEQNEKEGSKGERPLLIYWNMFLVCMECSSGKKVVSVE